MTAIGLALLVAAVPLALYAVLVVFVLLAYVRLTLWAGRGIGNAALIAREAWAQLVIVTWTLARRGRTLDIRVGTGNPVILIHGLAADGTSMWAYRRALAAAGRSTLSPHLGGMLRPIERYAAKLTRAFEEVLAAHPDADGVDVVCHSMGGIILRAALQARPDLAERVKRIVTVASPHTGTASAHRIPIPEARQLVVDGAYVRALPSQRALTPHALITTVASTADAVVYPATTCRVDGADHHELDGIGHAELLVHPMIVDLVVNAVS